MKSRVLRNQKQYYSIRKYSFGAASVLIGASFLMVNQVKADELGQGVSNDSVLTSISMIDETKDSEGTEDTVGNELLDNVQPLSESTDKMSDSEVPSTELPVDILDQAKDADQTVSTSLPQNGTYTYPDQTPVKNEPKEDAPVIFYASKGSTVNYDKVLDEDGHQWLSYVSFSGTRRYTDISNTTMSKPAVTPSKVEVKEASSPISLPSSGTYQFTKDSEVKNEASANVPVQFIYPKGSTVNYDKVMTADGIQWLSYISGTGIRRYANIGTVMTKAETVKPKVEVIKSESKSTVQTSLPSSGSYQFTEDSEVKNEASAKAPVQLIYRKGDQVSYDKVVQADGIQWISYVSYSGIRRYANVGRVETKETTVTPTNAKVERTGTISVENQSETGFDVVISNVESPKAIKTVKVPVWTDNKDQDDIVWYDGVKQENGSYKVSVKLSDHKNERGDYNIHLYYVESDGKIQGVATKKVIIEGIRETVPKAEVTNHKTKLQQSGSYVFTKDTEVKNQASKEAPVQFIYPKGSTVNYDKVLEADGIQWLSYISSSGMRRYANLGKVDNQAKPEVKPLAKKQDRTGTLTVTNQTDKGFDVIVTNVSDIKGLTDVKLPIWTEKAGQDDIIWYSGVKQANGDYKVSVKTSDHKNEIGVYNIHLYYQEKDSNLAGIATKQVTLTNRTNSSIGGEEIASRGTYVVKTDTEVKNQAKDSTPVQFYLRNGDRINYDKVVEADGHQWLSYISYSGTRRYAKLNQGVSVSEPVVTPSAMHTGAYPNLSDYKNLSISVSIANQTMSILSENQEIFKTRVSTGTAEDPTPRGHFMIEAERGDFFYNASVSEGAYYWVSFKGHGIYLFHSLPTDRFGNEIPSEASKLGTPSSHGCVRLARPDAKWFYENIPTNTPITIE